MSKIKSHKTVEQIAKKHKVDVSFIKNQLKMGIPVEHEHTNDKDLAIDIALQHLEEVPDYYTRLKKVESGDKKSIKEHCGCEDNAVKELESDLKKLNSTSYDSIDKLMRNIMKKHDMTAKQLHNSFVNKHNKTPDDWIKSLKEETASGDEGLHDWFNKSKSSDGKKGWVQLGGKWSGKPCARQPGQTSTPKCGSSKMKRNLSDDEEEAARRRKNRIDPNQPEKTGGAKPTNVRTEEMDLQEVKDKPSKGSGKKDACYNKVKSRYSVWPSAYASGALVKCRKVGAKNWGIKKEDYDDLVTDAGDWDSPMHRVATHAVHIKAEKRYCAKCKKEEHRHECKYGPLTWEIYSVPTKLKDMHTTNLHLESKLPEEKRYCPLCDKRETRSECSYGEKTWDKVSVKDHEYSMARSELATILDAAKRLQMKVGKGEGNLEAWVQSKITKAADYIDTVADYVASGEMEESLSFEIGKKEHKSAQKREKIRNLSKRGATEGERSAATKKLGSTAELPKLNKEEKIIDKILDEVSCWPGYKRKKGTKKYSPGSCVKKENVTLEDAEGNTFAEVIDIIKPEPIKGFKSQVDEATRLQAQTGNVMAITLSWRGKYYSLKMFFPQVKLPSRKEIDVELQKVYPGSKVIYHVVSDIQPGQPLIQSCGPQGGSSGKPGFNKNYVKPMGEGVELDEDWQSINRKDKTDGLSQKAVDAYRRENPGSKLKTAVTEKKPKGKRAKRRKSFCRRMKGMRSKLTSAKTARDPDSRINKALRRWRCR